MKKNATIYAKGNYLYAIIYLSNGKQIDLPIRQVTYNHKLQYLICCNVENLYEKSLDDVKEEK